MRSAYYLRKKEQERKGKKSNSIEGQIDISCCSSRLVLVHDGGGGGDSLLAITLIGIAQVVIRAPFIVMLSYDTAVSYSFSLFKSLSLNLHRRNSTTVPEWTSHSDYE